MLVNLLMHVNAVPNSKRAPGFPGALKPTNSLNAVYLVTA